MHLTSPTDYALRLLIYLAIHEGEQATKTQDVATRFGVSSKHPAKVAQALLQHDYIVSHRSGAFKLAFPVANIGIRKLIGKTEKLQLLPRFSDETACPIQPAYILRIGLHKAQTAFLNVLDDYNLADVIFNEDWL